MAWGIHNRHAFRLWWSEFHLVQVQQLGKCCLYQLLIFHQIQIIRLNRLASYCCQIITSAHTHPIHHHSFTFTYILHFCQFESQSSSPWLCSTRYSHMLPPFPGFHAFSHSIYVPVLSVPVSVIFPFLHFMLCTSLDLKVHLFLFSFSMLFCLCSQWYSVVPHSCSDISFGFPVAEYATTTYPQFCQ